MGKLCNVKPTDMNFFFAFIIQTLYKSQTSSILRTNSLNNGSQKLKTKYEQHKKFKLQKKIKNS